MRSLTLAGTAAAITAFTLLAACGPVSQGSSAAPHGVLTIANDYGSPWNCQFNPFNGVDGSQSSGPIYEPLAFVDALDNGKATPWLATSWRWGQGNKSLTFTIRSGVSFSDGTPLTAADVVFTFGLLRRFPALDQNNVWSVLSGVRQAAPNQVVMTFKTANVPYFYDIADQVPIVPEKIWAAIKNPVTYGDPRPVGTGAFKVRACDPREITYTANLHYWMPGEPRVARVEYPAFTSNDAPTTYLATGRAQWGGQFIPNIEAFYLSQNPAFHYWFPPLTNLSVVPNLKNPLLGNLKVRQAIAYAINRRQVTTLGEYGYESPANQASIVTPTFSGWLDKTTLASYGNSYNPAKARRLLAEAGFHPGRDGVMVNAHGGRLAFSIIDVSGYSDWNASVQVIQQDLRAIGIGLTPENLPISTYDDRLSYGDFQLAYYAQQGGPTPYYELDYWLSTANSARIGKEASSDYERYSSPATDRLISRYEATNDQAAQHRIVSELAATVLKDLPFIPVAEAADWYEYNTDAFSGWPTAANPYAQPSPYVSPDWGEVLLHLAPR